MLLSVAVIDMLPCAVPKLESVPDAASRSLLELSSPF
jgi:hypothetical protein